MIFKGSRYERTGSYTAIDADGRPVTALKIRLTPATPAGFVHTFRADERLDLLAYSYYRDAEKFWLICDANAGSALDPEDLAQPGRRLLIPPDRS